MKGKIKVLLCDDHTLFREGIKAILKDEPSIEIVGEAADGRQAVAQGPATASGCGADGYRHAGSKRI